MMKYDIAIVGAGIAGLAAAIFLNRQGHRITLFEKFCEPRPVGAGLVIQPLGLDVLHQLGLLKQALALGNPIDRFDGKLKDGRPVFAMTYATLNPERFALGIHRHSLFHLLYHKVKRLGVQIVTGFDADTIVQISPARYAIEGNATRSAGFHLIVDCSGSHSKLRDNYADVQRITSFDYGALWCVFESRELGLNKATLYQRIRNSDQGIGLFALGRRPDQAQKQFVAFHWSIRNKDHQGWRADSLEKWKDDVLDLWPKLEPLLDQLESHDQLRHATYKKVHLRKLYQDRIVFLGDSGHAMSPRLGQGANFALLDAWSLASCIDRAGSLDEALASFDLQRKRHIRFYQFASSLMGSFFQSNSKWLPAVRDLGFNLSSRFPLTHNYMLKTLAGVKTGLFTELGSL